MIIGAFFIIIIYHLLFIIIIIYHLLFIIIIISLFIIHYCIGTLLASLECASAVAVTRSDRASNCRQENAASRLVPVCLSRACLGKNDDHFLIDRVQNGVKKRRFLTCFLSAASSCRRTERRAKVPPIKTTQRQSGCARYSGDEARDGGAWQAGAAVCFIGGNLSAAVPEQAVSRKHTHTRTCCTDA
eukprot:COSAG06_NODE_790_length_12278_cov_52.245176_4_plen_187_part_00